VCGVGTYFSGALLGDLELLKCLASRDTKATAAGAQGEDEAEEARLEIMQAKDDVGMAPIHFSAFVGQVRAHRRKSGIAEKQG
jgi:hypothetical protein